jgi:hypothetical protein
VIEWSLHTHSQHWQHFQPVFLSLAVGQIEHLPWVQNGPVVFEKKHTIHKKKYMCRIMIILCHRALNEQMDKTGEIVTLYWRELFKKITRLGTFCTQSVNGGLSSNWLLLSSGRSSMAPS